MKKLFYILTFSFLMLFSCSSSNDESVDDLHPLVGIWIYTDQRPEENYQYSLTLKFNKNLTGSINRFEIHDGVSTNQSFNFTWSADSNQVITGINGEKNTSGYYISGNKLTFSDDDYVYIRQ